MLASQMNAVVCLLCSPVLISISDQSTISSDFDQIARKTDARQISLQHSLLSLLLLKMLMQSFSIQKQADLRL